MLPEMLWGLWVVVIPVFEVLQEALNHSTFLNHAIFLTTSGFQMFSGGIERDQWHDLG